MHYSLNGYEYASERTKKFLADNDQPAFFKDWLLKMQVPSAQSSVHYYMERVAQGLKCHPYSILLKVLDYAKREGIVLLKQEIGYYIFNSEDVLKGNATANEVFDEIMNDKRGDVPPRRIIIPEGESDSYDQHVSDQLKYLQMANLIVISGQEVSINKQEAVAIKAFTDLSHKPLGFDVYSYDLCKKEERRQFEQDWVVYYGELSKENSHLSTPVDALLGSSDEEPKIKRRKKNTVEFGDEGEAYVFDYETKRIKEFDKRLLKKLEWVGKKRGLGYDIRSVIAEKGDNAEIAKFIEVKSTKRVSAPDLSDMEWTDNVNVTRNEWVAAEQYGSLYYIYRVYFVRGGIVMYIIKDPYKKHKDNVIEVVPMMYRIDFKASGIDESVK